MKKYIFTLFSMLLMLFITIALIRTGTNKSPLDIRKTWRYIIDSDANFDSLDNGLEQLRSMVEGLSWDYQSTDDPSFFAQTANFFNNVGNFFSNVGKLLALVFFFIVYIFGKIIQYFIYFVKIFYYLLT